MNNMSDWFIADLLIIILASILAVYARIISRAEIKRVEEGKELSADDFEIIE